MGGLHVVGCWGGQRPDSELTAPFFERCFDSEKFLIQELMLPIAALGAFPCFHLRKACITLSRLS